MTTAACLPHAEPASPPPAVAASKPSVPPTPFRLQLAYAAGVVSTYATSRSSAGVTMSDALEAAFAQFRDLADESEWRDRHALPEVRNLRGVFLGTVRGLHCMETTTGYGFSVWSRSPGL